MDKAAFFDRWAASYDGLFPSVFYQAVHVRLLESIQLSAIASVLELGCGTGKLLNRLADAQSHLTGTGIDFSAGMIEQARQRTPFGDRLQFVPGNVETLPFDSATFDGIFCSISFLHYPHPERVLQEVARVLKQDGHFYLADFAPPRWADSDILMRGMTPGGVRFYSPRARAALGESAGLHCDRHVYLLGPVLLTDYVVDAPAH